MAWAPEKREGLEGLPSLTSPTNTLSYNLWTLPWARDSEMNQTRLCTLGAPIWGQGKQQRKSRPSEGVRVSSGRQPSSWVSLGRLNRDCDIGYRRGAESRGGVQ